MSKIPATAKQNQDLYPLDVRSHELSARDQLILLRGQLRLLRMRARAGMPISTGEIGRAERLANSLRVAE